MDNRAQRDLARLRHEQIRTDFNYKLFCFRYHFVDKKGYRDLAHDYRVNVVAKSFRDAVQWVQERNQSKIDIAEVGNSYDIHSMSGQVITEIVNNNTAWVKRNEEKQKKEEEIDKKLFQETGRLGLTLKK